MFKALVAEAGLAHAFDEMVSLCVQACTSLLASVHEKHALGVRVQSLLSRRALSFGSRGLRQQRDEDVRALEYEAAIGVAVHDQAEHLVV